MLSKLLQKPTCDVSRNWGQGPGSQSLLNLRFNLHYIRVSEVIILVSSTIWFESKTLSMHQNATNYLGSGENLPI